MEIRHMQHFRQACKDLSLSKAAENLFISQQGLSHSIGKLEHELGVTLFVRTKNGVIPTEAALSFIDDVEHVLLSFDAVKSKMHMTAKTVRGAVNIAMTPGATSHFVPKLVEEFVGLHPQIELRIKEGADGVIEGLVLSDESDIACTLGPVNTEIFDWTPLLTDDVMVMMRHDNPLACHAHVRFADLKNEKFIMLPPEFKWHHVIKERSNEAGFEPQVAFVTWDINIMFNLIKSVGGIGFLHRDIGRSFRTDENALLPIAKDEGLRWELGIISKKNRKLSQAGDVVANYIRKIASEIVTE
ncbi:MAG: LysR family transcriptional regulator [Clostridiales Family XIII bacterium]|jgi:DNA-binding transcriptional LysR family regulator|nr:LysR family transcriptional regulator [Clostridiales Family XIII bacterium]